MVGDIDPILGKQQDANCQIPARSDFPKGDTASKSFCQF